MHSGKAGAVTTVCARMSARSRWRSRGYDVAMSRARLFLLSPAHCGGERAKLIYRPEARFELAMQLRTPMGASIGTTFSFLSGLYFRGKLAYAQRFANPPPGACGDLVITTNRGLIPS